MADLKENARREAAGKKVIVLSPISIEIVRRIDACRRDRLRQIDRRTFPIAGAWCIAFQTSDPD
jgi:hypothetical protein